MLGILPLELLNNRQRLLHVAADAKLRCKLVANDAVAIDDERLPPGNDPESRPNPIRAAYGGVGVDALRASLRIWIDALDRQERPAIPFPTIL